MILKANERYLNNLPSPFNKIDKSYGRYLKDIISGFNGSKMEKAWKDAVLNNKPIYFEERQGIIPNSCNTYWDCKLIPICIDGIVKYIVSMLDDVTERVMSREHIKRQKEQMEAIIDNISEELYIIDKEGNYVKINKAARERYSDFKFSNSKEYVSKYKLFDQAGNEIGINNTPIARLAKGESIKNEIVIVNDPNKRYVCTNAKPILDENGDFSVGVLLSQDITERVLQEEKIRYQNEALEKAMEMKDEFLSIISHEFRTPLNVISTAIQAMNFLCADELSDRSKRYINTIRQNTFRQLRLVNNLLDITRADAGRIKIHKKNVDVVFLTKSIADSVYSYASQKGVTITFLTSVKKKVIGIDDEKYERILLNLLSNAIKFTPEGKNIVVKLRTIKGKVCVEVKDCGIGIPKDKLQIIFERFGQVDSSLSRQAEGAGIGLSLVKKLIEALGGTISVKSKEGKGSSFIVLLPDERVLEEEDENSMADLMDNRLIQTARVEFSDIYL